MSKVYRSESNTERFGRVITYSIVLDGVTFQAERMVGLTEDYSISTHVGHCGMSFHHPTGPDGKGMRVKGGRGVAARFEAIATELRANPVNFIDPKHADPDSRSASLCTDKAACDRFRLATVGE